MNNELAIETCKNLVLENLKSPATADFSKIDLIETDSFGRPLFYVEVDSQNGFGALIRTKMYVLLQTKDNGETFFTTNHSLTLKNFFIDEDSAKMFNDWDKDPN